MIDTTPQHQDQDFGGADLTDGVGIPRHDPVAVPADEGPVALPFSHEDAERAVQRLSRWAGPFALIAAVVLIVWLLIR